jgi:hypothetical protein
MVWRRIVLSQGSLAPTDISLLLERQNKILRQRYCYRGNPHLSSQDDADYDRRAILMLGIDGRVYRWRGSVMMFVSARDQTSGQNVERSEGIHDVYIGVSR